MAMKTLVELRRGQKGRVVMIRGRGSFHLRLAHMGIGIGHTVEMGSASQEGGHLDIKVDGINASLPARDCGNICVEVLG